MFKFTRAKIVFLLCLLIFCLVQIFIYHYHKERNKEIVEEIMKEESLVEDNAEIIEEHIEQTNNIWQIQIPKISLIANISEGTTTEVLNQYVGHFENTQKELGNIGLAAHNRGYEVNYFKDLKLLKQGDEIIYKYNEYEKIYEVEKCRIIKDTEWEYLEKTEDNRLTLITCVENEPEFRRCVQAVEKEEEDY